MLTQKGRKEFQQRLGVDPEKFINAMKNGKRGRTTLLALNISEKMSDINTKSSTNPEKDAAFVEAVKWYIKERTAFLDGKKQQFGRLSPEEESEKITTLDDINEDIKSIEQSGKLKFSKQVEMAEFNQANRQDPARHAKKAALMKNMMITLTEKSTGNRKEEVVRQALRDVDKRMKILTGKQQRDSLSIHDIQEWDDLAQSKRLIVEYLQPKNAKSNPQPPSNKDNMPQKNSLQQKVDSVADKSLSPTANMGGIRSAYAESYLRQKCLYEEPFDDQLLNEQVYNAPLNINAKWLDSDDREIYENLVRESFYYSDQYAQKFKTDMRAIRETVEKNIDRDEMNDQSEKQFSKKYVEEFEKRFNEKGYSRKFDNSDKEKIGRLASKFYKENRIDDDDDVLNEMMETPGDNLGEFEQKSRKEILKEYLEEDNAKIAVKGSAVAALISEFEQQVGQLEKLKKSSKDYGPLQEKAFSNYAKLQQLYRQSSTDPQLLGNYKREELGRSLQVTGKRFDKISGTIEAKVLQLTQELEDLSIVKQQGKSNSKLEGKAFAHMAELQHLYRMHMLQQRSDNPQSVLGQYDPALLEKNIINADSYFKEFSNNSKWAERNNHDLVNIDDILLDDEEPKEMADSVMERLRQYAAKVKKDYDPWLDGKYSKSLTKAEKEDIREQRNREFNIGRRAIMEQLADSNNIKAFNLVAQEFDEYKFKPSKKMGQKRGFRGLCRDSRTSTKNNPVENNASSEVDKYVKSVQQGKSMKSVVIMADYPSENDVIANKDSSIEDDLLVINEVYRNQENIAMADASSIVSNDEVEPMGSFISEGNKTTHHCQADDHLVSEQGFYKKGATQTSHGEEFDMKKVLKDGMADDITGNKGKGQKIKEEFDKAQEEGDKTTTIKLGNSSE